MMPRIKTMYAYVAEVTPGNDGIAAACSPGLGALPLVSADLDQIKSFERFAQRIANETGREVRLVRFSVRSDLEIIKPGGSV